MGLSFKRYARITPNRMHCSSMISAPRWYSHVTSCVSSFVSTLSPSTLHGGRGVGSPPSCSPHNGRILHVACSFSMSLGRPIRCPIRCVCPWYLLGTPSRHNDTNTVSVMESVHSGDLIVVDRRVALFAPMLINIAILEYLPTFGTIVLGVGQSC